MKFSHLLSLLAFASLTLNVHARTWVVAANQPGAADINTGAPEQPLLTINAAAQQAQPGDVVLVRAGIYRERITPACGGEPGKPIRYEAAPGEMVVVKGSDAWSDWQPVKGQPGVYTSVIDGKIPAGKPNPFLIGISIASKDLNLVARPSAILNRLPKTLSQVFFDGRPMVEAISEKIVSEQENSWVVTADGTRLLAHFPGNPESITSHLVEVSVRNRIFAPHRRGLNEIQIRGFTFEHCANQGPFPQGGAVSPRTGSNWVIENNTIRFAKTIGVDIGSETFASKELKETDEDQKVRMAGGHHLIQNNIVSDNGLCGIAGWEHGGAVIRGNIVERNNRLGFNDSDAKWEEWGGIKLHEGPAVIEGNLIRDNDSYGIWLDNNYTGSRISRNVVLNNRSAGIFLELGDGHVLIDNNIIAFTRPRDAFYPGDGIYAHDAAGLVIAHNLIAYNANYGVQLRTVSDRVFKGKTVHTSRTRILNNILWNNSRSAISLPYPSNRAEDNLSDYNVLNTTRDLRLGHDSDPSLFAVNLFKSNVTIDQLIDRLRETLTKANVPDEEWPRLKSWRRNPTLSLSQWRLFMGQDLHSTESPKLVSLLFRPCEPILTFKADPSILQMSCPAVEGVTADFLGRKMPAQAILPGPFQSLSETETEQILFPVRGTGVNATPSGPTRNPTPNP